MDPSEFGKGAVPDKKDKRDFTIAKAGLPPVALPREYSLKDKISKVKSQGSSGSCVGQAFSYYAEVKDKIETEKGAKLSARDLYSQIHLEQSGAYLRDGAKQLKKTGCIPEDLLPSHNESGKSPEHFMRSRDEVTKAMIREGYKYLADSYLSPELSFQGIKEAIYRGDGCVLGVRGSNIAWRQPNGMVGLGMKEWAHAVYCTGWEVFGGKQYIEFVNSWGPDWGDKGFGYLSPEHFQQGYVFSPWTIIDLPNDTYEKLVKKAGLLQIILNLLKKLKALRA